MIAYRHRSARTIGATLALSMCIAGASSQAWAQNASHPDAKPVVPDNPYISYRDAWRWDIRTQLFLNSANITADNPSTPGRNYNEEVITTLWTPREVELVLPVVREGGFYWSPNTDVEVDIRLDDVDLYGGGSNQRFRQNGAPDAPVVGKDVAITQKFVEGTNAEYTHWQSGDIDGRYRQLHVIHNSHIVSADTVFNDQLARQLPWPETWSPETQAFLTPVVDTVGAPVHDDAEETIAQLVEFWIGEDIDPKSGPQLDVVKFLTGKVIEYFTIRGQGTEFTQRTTAGGRPSFVVSSNTWGGFIVRPADAVAREPSGSRHDLAVLLTSVLRSAGVPARTVICIDQQETDPLLNTVSMVEFAMRDPDRDLTFWVPIDIDRVRVSGARSSQYQRKWLYFGTHDRLSHMIPIAYYFHPPARYQSFEMPLLYGIRSVGDVNTIPDYMIQALLVDTINTPATGNDRRRTD